MNKNPVSKFFALIRSFLGSFFSAIVGRISWSCPPWMLSLRQSAVMSPKKFLSVVCSLLLLFIASVYGYHWYKHLPQPKWVTAHVTPPQITPLAKVLVPDNLIVDFGMQNGEFASRSVAPLKSVGKEVTDGITLTPAMPGKWLWQTDSQLVFTPSQDWPAGQTYTIQFAKKDFSSNTKINQLAYEFSTQPFKISIAEYKFYQDPIDPQVKQAVATLEFNYPVDTASLENKMSLLQQSIKNTAIDFDTHHFKFTLTYDEHKRIAYLRSESLPLPKLEYYLELNVDKGIKALNGPSTNDELIQQSILIPDANSYLKVNRAIASIIRNNQDRPEQILTIETTVGVTEAELNKSLHVYLLPQDYPATAGEDVKEKYHWHNPGEVTPNILALSTPVVLKALPTDHDYSSLHSYQLQSDSTRFIYLKLDKGMRSFGNFELANDYAKIIKVPAYPKEINFLHKGALLALSGEKKLSVVVRGVPAVKFDIARVLPDDINHLMTQTQGNFSDPHFINPGFDENNISEIFSEVQPFDAEDLSKEQYTAIDLGKYLANKSNVDGPLGLFLLQAHGWNTAKKVPLEVSTSRLVLVTDLGIIVKDNRDGTHDVFVQSITKESPVANVKVVLLGKNGLPIVSRTTDATGHANFPSVVDFTAEHEPTVYLATLAKDVAFMPYNNADRQLNYSRFDVGGVVSSDQEAQTLSAYLFSDRGIYRPGDTAHIGMIIKQAYAQPQPPGLPLEATITDPRGTTVQDQKFILDQTGLLSLDFHTDASSPTGQYVINLYIVKDNHPSSLLGTTSINVAEFQPDRMRITSHFSVDQTTGWLSPTGLTTQINLRNLYGAPAANRKVSGKILLAPQPVQFEEYPHYVFMDPLIDPAKPPKVFSDTLTDVKTNDQGDAELNLDLARFDKATYRLTVYAEGFESDAGRSVTTQSTALVSPLTYLVGYKADGDLHYIKQNSQRSVNFIAVNHLLKPELLANVKVQLLSLQPVTTLIKNPNGTYQYKSIVQTKIISTNPITIAEAGTHYPLPTQQIGDFAVSIIDQHHVELSRVPYTVVGASQAPLAKNAELSMQLNKSEYVSDEDIQLQITAPYTGGGLITIERDKVYAYQWFKTDTTNSVQKIHIPKDFQGNGYVSVAFVRDWDSPEIFTSPLSYSVAPFNVNHAMHNVNIDLTTPAVAQPGMPFTIAYKSDKPGKMIVFAVDEGVLQVAHYETPDPLNFFFQKHALEVLTQQTVDQILPKFIAERELAAVGGDMSAKALQLNINPFKRKTDLPVAYWSGIVDTDTTVRQLVYNVPDYFNGTLRVMAVAIANDAVGATSKTSEIRGNFVINPNVPTFAAPNDTFDITASIANNIKNSGVDAKVSVQLTETPQVEIIGGHTQTLTIAEGHEGTAHFKLRATALLGSADVTFVATSANKTSKSVATLSVRPANAYATTILTGNSHDKNIALSLDRELYPEYRSVNVALSTNPLILVVGLQRYLDNFPFGCTEQLVSKAFPLLVMSNQPWFSQDTRALTDKVQATIQMLGQRQMSNGGFSYWPTVGEYSSNIFASVYAMHFLTEARGHGFTIPGEIFHLGIGYLKEVAAQPVTNLDDARIQAYAIYLLTRNEIVTTNYLTHLQLYLDQDTKHRWKHDIISAYIAATYQLMKSYPEANRLIAGYHLKQDVDHTTTDFNNDNIEDAQYLYLLARQFPDRLMAEGSHLIEPLVTAMNNSEINTIFSSYASLALSAYAQSYQTNNKEGLIVHESWGDGKEKVLTTGHDIYQQMNIQDTPAKIVINNPQNQPYFYQLTQSGFDKKTGTESLQQGVEIFREYRDLQGNVITDVALGDEIEVHIQVRALNDYLNNMAIVDLLPGGFEVVRDSVHADNMDYADVREDRVIFFGGLSTEVKQITYHIKATNAGDYTVPSIEAASMYNPAIKARSSAGHIKVH